MLKRKLPGYYLLYKLVSKPIMWVVSVSDDVEYLYSRIENVISKHEEYYLIKRYVNNLDDILNTKQFTIFKPNKGDIIINQTMIDRTVRYI